MINVGGEAYYGLENNCKSTKFGFGIRINTSLRFSPLPISHGCEILDIIVEKDREN
jgi:hypothetical protein